MSKMSPKRAQKKKEREKVARKRVLARRAALRAPKSEENKLRRKMKRIGKLQKSLGDLNKWADNVLLGMNEKTLSQLERNAEILRALESEYEKDFDAKQKINQELESKGLFTLEEKMSYLHNQLVEQQMKAGAEVLGEELALAQEASAPREPRTPVEVAEVNICRAPGFESTEEKVPENQ